MLLQRLGKRELDYNILSLDSECDSEGATYIWCVEGFYKGKNISKQFTNKKSVCKYLFQRRWEHTILTGVNLAFDLNTLIGRGCFNWECLYNMGKLITASPTKKQSEKHSLSRRHIKIIEIGSFIPGSLQSLCQKFNISGHLDKHILGVDGDKEELIEACKSHARCGVLVFDYIQKQIHYVDGRVKLTAASTAQDLFLYKHLKEEDQIYDFKKSFPKYFIGFGNITKNNYQRVGKKRLEVARCDKLDISKESGGLAYFGGRCEVFKLGRINNVSSIDINSSYPSQMRNYPIPNPNTFELIKSIDTEDFIEYYLYNYEGTADVFIEAPDTLIPLLPIYYNEKLIFPVGQFSGSWTFPELRKAVEVGYKIIWIKRVTIYSAYEDFFKSFIDSAWSLKLNPQTKLIGKLMMNSLYGKFGQRAPSDGGWKVCDESEITRDMIFDNEGVYINPDGREYSEINNQLYEYIHPSKDFGFVGKAYPVIAAYVTAYGRLQLYNAMQAVGFENVYYCDTDSIHADSDAVQAAEDSGLIKIHESELGAWGYDYTRGEIEIRGLKYYRYRSSETAWVWDYHIKGVAASLQRQYWLNKCGWCVRVRKLAGALRGNNRVNEFYTLFRKDVTIPDKRIFFGTRSEPIKI